MREDIVKLQHQLAAIEGAVADVANTLENLPEKGTPKAVADALANARKTLTSWDFSSVQTDLGKAATA